ncbi:hypothetical protein CgunFtcFv8_015667 [Champsocephalus gunnari]|uniref:Uncharacterized protein n=1 Tax=Champsocephalus gunnari TaxID=52237 RepID=A0AAN8C9C6_CHAGU|nr:hypothetical protein CgunFtcFv8_015667 [Champsocephalus gunnari]
MEKETLGINTEWLSVKLFLFYVVLENFMVARAFQSMPNPCVYRPILQGLLEPHVFLMPHGIAIKPLLK